MKVSELLGTQEVVVKPLGGHVSRLDGMAGATVRGDGSDIEQPEAYLMRTATNVWRDFLRKKRTHAQDFHEEFLEELIREGFAGIPNVDPVTEDFEFLPAGSDTLPATVPMAPMALTTPCSRNSR